MTALRDLHAADLDRQVAAGAASMDEALKLCAAGAHFCRFRYGAWRCESCGTLVADNRRAS